MAYSHEKYMRHHASIRKAQKKYYEKNKKKIVKKYASVRRKWDKAHRKYLNEHNHLSAIIRSTSFWNLPINVTLFAKIT